MPTLVDEIADFSMVREPVIIFLARGSGEVDLSRAERTEFAVVNLLGKVLIHTFVGISNLWECVNARFLFDLGMRKLEI